MTWIRTTDRLPEFGAAVFFSHPSNVVGKEREREGEYGFFEGRKGFRGWQGARWPIAAVAFWMPEPEVPQGEDGE